MKVETLKQFGWQRIASDAHAAQLLRRELKHHSRWQQRDPTYRWDYRVLLAIKRGSWFKFLKNRKNGYCSILIWRKKVGGE